MWCTSFGTSNWSCQKSSIKSTILFWLWSTSENAWACWGHRHITWHSNFNFARTIHYEKSIDKMGAAFAHCGSYDRVTISKQCLEIFQRNPDEFLGRFITVDETWIHYFIPKTKKQSKQPTSKMAKIVKSVGKVIIIVFWDVGDIIRID